MTAEQEKILTQINQIVFQARTLSTESPVTNLLDNLLTKDDCTGLLPELVRLLEDD